MITVTGRIVCDSPRCKATLSYNVVHGEPSQIIAVRALGRGWVIGGRGGRLPDSGHWCPTHAKLGLWTPRLIYRIVCGGCYQHIEAETEDGAADSAIEAGWAVQGHAHRCPGCRRD